MITQGRTFQSPGHRRPIRRQQNSRDGIFQRGADTPGGDVSKTPRAALFSQWNKVADAGAFGYYSGRNVRRSF
jgi:hypothetical protein